MFAKSALLAFGLSLSALAGAADQGGLKHVFTEVNGHAIAHSPDYPQDGIGTVTYLKEVCRSLQHDELVSFKIQKAQYFDLESKQWLTVDAEPRIYQSVTCAVYVR